MRWPFFSSKNLITIFGLAALLVSYQAQGDEDKPAAEVAPQEKNHNLDITQGEVQEMVEKMKQNGEITEGQAQEATEKLKNMSEKEMEALKRKSLDSFFAAQKKGVSGDVEKQLKDAMKLEELQKASEELGRDPAQE